MNTRNNNLQMGTDDNNLQCAYTEFEELMINRFHPKNMDKWEGWVLKMGVINKLLIRKTN